MALGRQGERQADLMLSWAELPRSPGHAFYDRLQAVLVEAGFDGFAEGQCAPYYAGKRGRPSLPPGRYFRMHLVGYFEGIDSERGLEWRCADSLSLRQFLRLGTTEPVPEHAVDLDTGAIVAAEVHAADQGDTATLPDTLAAAEANLAAVGAAPTPEDPAELVADKILCGRSLAA